MANWLLTQEPPAGFTIDRECELKASDDSKAVVRYAKHPLDIDEVKQHITDGKRPTRLALTWDDRVSFELTHGMLIRKITFLEGTGDGASGGKKEDNFDADVAIATGELGQLVPALLDALGGEAAFSAAMPDDTAKPAAAAPTTTTPADAPEEEEDAPF
jgi:recombination associated protein RdgC